MSAYEISLVDSFVIRPSLVNPLYLDAMEYIFAVDTATSTMHPQDQLLESSILFEHDLSSSGTFSNESTEELAFISQIFDNAVHGLFLLSDFVIDVSFDGHEGLFCSTIAFNTSAFAPSIYTGYHFSGYCPVSGGALAVRDDGIYAFDDSNTDVDGEFTTGILYHETSLGSMLRKKYRKAFFHCEGGPLEFYAAVDGIGQRLRVKGKEAPMRRDMRGVSWTFAIGGFDVFSFAEVFPITLVR